MAGELAATRAFALIEATTVNIFNEHDAGKRRALMKEHWSDQITLYSPYGANKFDEIDQVYEGVYSKQAYGITQRANTCQVSMQTSRRTGCSRRKVTCG